MYVCAEACQQTRLYGGAQGCRIMASRAMYVPIVVGVVHTSSLHYEVVASRVHEREVDNSLGHLHNRRLVVRVGQANVLVYDVAAREQTEGLVAPACIPFGRGSDWQGGGQVLWEVIILTVTARVALCSIRVSPS